MQILQDIFNHSDVKTTNRYIGLDKKKVNQYFIDFGNFFEGVESGNELHIESDALTTTLKSNDLRDIIALAYEAGRNNASENAPAIHIEAINELQELIDSLKV